MLVASLSRLGSHQAERLRTARKLASCQHIDWVRTLDKKKTAEEDLMKFDWAVRQRKGMQPPKRSIKLSECTKARDFPPLEDLEALLNPKSSVELSSTSFGPFGTIKVIHGDIFTEKSEAIAVPLPCNLQPYRGLGLRVLERGGEQLVQNVFSAATKLIGENFGRVGGLEVGSVISVRGAQGFESKLLLFVIMPYYWQGTTTDAARRFRFAFQNLLNKANELGVSSLSVPHIGRGVYGFEQDWSFHTLIEEAAETGLLQLSSLKAAEGLCNIRFIDEDLKTAKSLKSALGIVSERICPEKRVVEAAEYFGEKSKRLLVLHEIAEMSKNRKRDKVKFKQYSGIIRSLRLHYKRFIRPHVWRAAKTLPVPPLLLRRIDGRIATKQNQATPFYKRGVTHSLFPTRRPSSGLNGPKKIQALSRPKL